MLLGAAVRIDVHVDRRIVVQTPFHRMTAVPVPAIHANGRPRNIGSTCGIGTRRNRNRRKPVDSLMVDHD